MFEGRTSKDSKNSWLGRGWREVADILLTPDECADGRWTRFGAFHEIRHRFSPTVKHECYENEGKGESWYN
jgi:hypothetical protein